MQYMGEKKKRKLCGQDRKKGVKRVGEMLDLSRRGLDIVQL